MCTLKTAYPLFKEGQTYERHMLRGDMYYANLGTGIESEQEGYRPAVIMQNNTGNGHSPTVVSGYFQQGRRKAN